MITTREYRCDALFHIAVQETEGAPIVLEKLAAALEEPVFPLYLGRKSCPPALPLAPLILDGTLAQVFYQAEQALICRNWRQSLPHLIFAIGKASRRALCLLFPFREAISHSVKYAGSSLRVLSLQASSGRKNNVSVTRNAGPRQANA